MERFGRAGRLACGIVAAASCSSTEVPPGAAQGNIERIVAGDTTIVRNHSPLGVWGDTMTLEVELEIGAFEGPSEVTFGDVAAIAVRPDGNLLVLDAQVPAIREFRPDGTYLRSLGRLGQGPGEFERPRALQVDRTGRTLVLDWNRRLTVFGPDGTPEKSWLFNTFYPDYTFTVDTLGNTYVLAPGPRPEGAPPGGTRLAYVRYSPEGVPGDTLPEGGWLYDPPGPRRATPTGPFGPRESYKPLGIAKIHPFGWTLTARADRYSVDLTPHISTSVDGGARQVLRIERVTDPAPINDDEWAEWHAYLDAAMDRQMQARASLPLEVRMQLGDPTPYYFPETPVKPYLGWPTFGKDGRIWLERYTPAVKLPARDEAPRRASTDGPPALPELTWVEPIRYDVFELDGTFLGTVAVPLGLTVSVRGTDRVWGVRKDELEVEYVYRAKLVPLHAS